LNKKKREEEAISGVSVLRSASASVGKSEKIEEKERCARQMGHAQLVLLVLAGALWGCTNPFIKRGSEGVSRRRDGHGGGGGGGVFADIVFLFRRWRYVVPFAVN
jgi:hypothetical protein